MPTLTVFRRTAAAPFGVAIGTATAGSTGTASVVIAASPYKSLVSQDDLFSGWWLFRPTAAATGDKIRLVKTASGYTPSLGELTPDNAYTNPAYSGGVGETVELHRVVPPWDGASTATLLTSDLHSLINEALKLCFVERDYTFQVADTLTTRHSLAAVVSWLDDPDLVYQVGLLSNNEVRTQQDPFAPSRQQRGCQVYRESGVVYLEGPQFQTTDTVYVKVLAPAYYVCAAAGTPTTYTQTGLAAEGDVALPHQDWVAAKVRQLVWERLGFLIAPGDEAKIEKEQRDAAALFTLLDARYADRPERTVGRQAWRPLVWGGSYRHRWGGR